MAKTDFILTPKARISFPNLTQPDEKGKFGAMLIFEPGTDLTALKRLALSAIKEEWGDKFKPAQLTLPFKDGNDKVNDSGEVWPQYKDATLVSISSKFQPGVLDGTRGKKAVPTAEIDACVYAGCYVIAQVNAFTWEYRDPKTQKVVKRGVSFGFQNLLKYAEGDPLVGGARQSAEAAFADIELDSENPDNYPAATADEGDGWDL